MTAATAAGLFLSSLAILAIAYTKTRDAELGLREASAFLSLISLIESEIREYRTPLSDILARADGVLVELGFIKEAKASLVTGVPPRYRGHRLTHTEKECIELLFADLGSGLADEESKRCRRAVETLRASVEARRSELPKKKRLYRVTALSLVLMLFILFI